MTATLPLRDDHVMLRAWTADDADALEPWLRPGHRWQELEAPYFPRPTADVTCSPDAWACGR